MRLVTESRARSGLQRLRERRQQSGALVDSAVQRIVHDVAKHGDLALRRYAKQFDGLAARDSLRVSRAEMRKAWREIPDPLRQALIFAAENIRQFAEWQRPREWRRPIVPGLRVGQMVRPLKSVGCYIPAGRYPLPSTLLMTAIPAQVAGVRRIVAVSPRPTREILAAASLLGIDEFYRIGGAQAIAALAYGTKTVPSVDKIVGPGNAYVTSAKKFVSVDCAIDMLAGPTETLIYSDSGRPSFIAADLVAQAEHDIAATAIFVTTRRQLAEKVLEEVWHQAKGNPTAERALKRNGVIFLARSRAKAFEIINALAPEHLTVDAGNLEAVENAGSIFVGDYSVQPVGDYCAGPSHVLPTGGTARWRGGLGVQDFVKIISVQESSRKGVQNAGACAITMAEAEGLPAHANAVRLRLGQKAYA